MTKPIKIVAFAGSTRDGSYNKKLLKTAVAGATAAGAEVNVIDLRDYQMPLYDGDLESASGLPEKAQALKKIFRESDGFLIASPEYNSSYSAVLKNTIDWISRQSEPNEPGFSAFAGRHAAIVSASPGALRGIRGLFALRELLQNIMVTVQPNMMAVAASDIGDDGKLKDEKTGKAVEKVGADLVETLKKLRA